MSCPPPVKDTAVCWVRNGEAMLSGTSLLDPTLINSVGHTAGILLFGLILGLLVRDRQARRIRPIGLSLLAAGLALLWNVGSLIALASPNPKSILIGTVMTISFCALSLLPAVLLQVALRGQEPALTTAGYSVSAVAMALHITELLASNALWHQLGLVLVIRDDDDTVLEAEIDPLVYARTAH